MCPEALWGITSELSCQKSPEGTTVEGSKGKGGSGRPATLIFVGERRWSVERDRVDLLRFLIKKSNHIYFKFT